jgi:hypothetical protein
VVTASVVGNLGEALEDVGNDEAHFEVATLGERVMSVASGPFRLPWAIATWARVVSATTRWQPVAAVTASSAQRHEPP